MMDFLVWQRVRESASRFPDRLAVSDGRETLTYAELVSAADGVSRALTSAGLRPGDRVGVLARKSARCVAGMLGASQAGAIYVPVDPKAPAARSTFVLANAGVGFLITEVSLASRLDLTFGQDGIPEPGRILLLDDDGVSDAQGPSCMTWDSLDDRPGPIPLPVRTEDDPAYILYTSGSTGRPKGVVISHRNALTFIDWGRRTFEVGPEDRLSNHAPFHFDLSVFDLYVALSSGASVHIVHDRVAPFPGSLARWIDETRISVWYSVPSALIRILLHGDPGRFDYSGLRAVLFAGEVFPEKHLRAVMDLFATAHFHNLYGPTETNVCTHYAVPRPLPREVKSLPIGPACPNMEAFALTDSGALGATDDEGELIVRGPCVMLGYWDRAERTAQSLVQNPLHTRFVDPVYRTGDRVRVLDGAAGFEFLGRKDHMVKVRGYRVELGEIEQALLNHDAVREAAVVAVEDEEVGARLLGAVVLHEGRTVGPNDLTQHCLLHLPRYAVPESLAQMPDLPRTSTGKTDRISLHKQLTSSNP